MGILKGYVNWWKNGVCVEGRGGWFVYRFGCMNGMKGEKRVGFLFPVFFLDTLHRPLDSPARRTSVPWVSLEHLSLLIVQLYYVGSMEFSSVEDF